MLEAFKIEIENQIIELDNNPHWNGLYFNISEPLVSKLADYFALLSKWTERVDLVAESSVSELVLKHLVDCAVGWSVCLSKMKLANNPIVLDVGCGAGLPGVVIALLSPSSKVHLLEPRSKRIQFLKEVRLRLQLSNVEIHHCRLEDINVKDFPNQPNLAVTRAFSGEELFLTECARLLAKNGYAAIFQGPSWKLAPEHKELTTNGRILKFNSETNYSLQANNHHRILATWQIIEAIK